MPNVGTVFTSLPSLYGEHIPGALAPGDAAKTARTLGRHQGRRHHRGQPARRARSPRAAGGFKLMHEDRGDAGRKALAKTANDLAAAASKDPAFAGVFTTTRARPPSTPAIDRQKAQMVGLTPTDVFSTLSCTSARST